MVIKFSFNTLSLYLQLDNDDLARQLYGEGGSCETVREQGDCDGQISLGPMGNPYWDGYGKDMCPVSCEGA